MKNLIGVNAGWYRPPVLTLTVLVAAIDAQWEGMEDVQNID